MKKIFTVLVAILLSVGALHAQTNLHLVQKVPFKGATATKVMVESTALGDNFVNYALLSGDFYRHDQQATGFFYTQLFREQKFWKKPIFMHAEFRTYNFNYNILYLGGAYDIFTKHGMIAIEPLYRNNALNLYNKKKAWDWKGSSAQLSVVTGHDWGWCNMNSFTDIWTDNGRKDGAGWYSEIWYYVPVTKHLQLGTISSFTKEEHSKFDYSVSLGFKVNL